MGCQQPGCLLRSHWKIARQADGGVLTTWSQEMAELRDTPWLVLQAGACPAFVQTLDSARRDSRAPARQASLSPLLSLTAVTVTFVKHKRNLVTCPHILQRVSEAFRRSSDSLVWLLSSRRNRAQLTFPVSAPYLPSKHSVHSPSPSHFLSVLGMSCQSSWLPRTSPYLSSLLGLLMFACVLMGR